MPVRGPLRFIHISDTHINPDVDFKPNYVPATSSTPLVSAAALVEHLYTLPFKPDFVLHTGDITSDPVNAYYTTARVLLTKIPVPLYYVVGNHDSPEGVRSLIEEPVSFAPTGSLDYTFEHDSVQILCLDSACHSVHHASKLSDAQLAWVESICAANDDRPLIVAVHHPVLPIGVPWIDNRMRLLNGEMLHTILLKAQKRLRGVFLGHIHQSIDVLRDGILYSSAQSSWYQLNAFPHTEDDQPDEVALPGFSAVTITAQQTVVRRHTFSVGPDTASRLTCRDRKVSY